MCLHTEALHLIGLGFYLAVFFFLACHVDKSPARTGKDSSTIKERKGEKIKQANRGKSVSSNRSLNLSYNLGY